MSSCPVLHTGQPTTSRPELWIYVFCQLLLTLLRTWPESLVQDKSKAGADSSLFFSVGDKPSVPSPLPKRQMKSDGLSSGHCLERKGMGQPFWQAVHTLPCTAGRHSLASQPLLLSGMVSYPPPILQVKTVFYQTLQEQNHQSPSNIHAKLQM